MQIEEITEALNKVLDFERKRLDTQIEDGKFVVRRFLNTKKPPVFKEFNIETYYVSSTGDKKLCSKITHVFNCPIDKIEDTWYKLSKLYLEQIMLYVRGVEFSNIVYGIIN